VYGSDGTISVGWSQSKYRHTSARDWNIFGNGYDKRQALRSQIENFSRAILVDEPLLITPEDSLASVEVIEAAYYALLCNRWTPIDDERRPRSLVA
jgi:predicted dehydrogenase